MRSKAVVSAGYDAATLALELEFRSGHVYRYEGVPRTVFEWLLRIENKGGFVRRMIQGRYPESALGREEQGRQEGRQPRGKLAAADGESLEDALRASLEQLGKPSA